MPSTANNEEGPTSQKTLTAAEVEQARKETGSSEKEASEGGQLPSTSTTTPKKCGEPRAVPSTSKSTESNLILGKPPQQGSISQLPSSSKDAVASKSSSSSVNQLELAIKPEPSHSVSPSSSSSSPLQIPSRKSPKQQGPFSINAMLSSVEMPGQVIKSYLDSGRKRTLSSIIEAKDTAAGKVATKAGDALQEYSKRRRTIANNVILNAPSYAVVGERELSQLPPEERKKLNKDLEVLVLGLTCPSCSSLIVPALFRQHMKAVHGQPSYVCLALSCNLNYANP